MAYSSLFSSNPYALQRICKLFMRFPEYVSPGIKTDFMILMEDDAFQSKKNSIFENCEDIKALILKEGIVPERCFAWESHCGLVCFDLTCDQKEGFYNHAVKHFPDIYNFVAQNS